MVTVVKYSATENVENYLKKKIQLAFALSLYSEAYKPQQPTDGLFLQPRLLWETTTMMFINK